MLIILFLLFAVAAAAEESTRKIENTFDGAIRLEIENVNGPIRVVGDKVAAIRVTVTETFRADSAEKLEQGKREVRLDMTQQGSTARLYVDGPFRCNCGEGRRGSVNFRRNPGYKFHHAIEVRVPAGTALDLRTINEGEIRVDNVAGDFDIENINGGVTLEEMSGSGRAYALNGKLRATFRSNPKGNSYFGSLNGDVDVFFQPGLSADMWVKTFNGAIYSDFPYAALPAPAAESRREGGKFVYKTNRFTGVRVGQGGPEIKLDGFNGTIRVHQRAI